jgi:hypothetical protein
MNEEGLSFAYRMERVRDLLEGAYNSEDRALQLAAFASASIIIQWLESGDARYDINFDPNRAKMLSAIRMHFASMLGLDEMKGMTAERHYENASEAISELLANYVT